MIKHYAADINQYLYKGMYVEYIKIISTRKIVNRPWNKRKKVCLPYINIERRRQVPKMVRVRGSRFLIQNVLELLDY